MSAEFVIARKTDIDKIKVSIPEVTRILVKKASEVLPQIKNVKSYQCPEADQEHAESSRQYMHVSTHTPADTICYAKAAEQLSTPYKVGLIVHELGHLALIMLGYDNHEEDQANTAGWWLTGIPVFWRGRKRLEWSPVPDWFLRKI